MPLLTPAGAGTLTLTPISLAANSYLIQADRTSHFNLGATPGVILLAHGGGLTLAPITPGVLPLTPNPIS